MGIPVGSDDYVSAQTMELAKSAVHSLHVTGTISDNTYDIGRMCRTIALRLCVGAKRFQHILRVVPRRLDAPACYLIDSSMRGQLAALLQQTRVTDRAWHQALLRMS